MGELSGAEMRPSIIGSHWDASFDSSDEGKIYARIRIITHVYCIILPLKCVPFELSQQPVELLIQCRLFWSNKLNSLLNGCTTLSIFFLEISVVPSMISDTRAVCNDYNISSA